MCKLGVHLSVQSSVSLLMCPEVVYALRLMLDELGVEKAWFYRPHDLRRGHAEDLRLSGCHQFAAVIVRSHLFAQVRPCGKYWQQENGDLQPSCLIWMSTKWKLRW